MRSFDSRFKVHPPLRSPRHIETLCQAVADGTIDAIQSRHMPRSREKMMNDLDQAPFGISSRNPHSRLRRRHWCVRASYWIELIERMSTRPAQIAGLDAGTLQRGRPADVVVIDPNAGWKVNPGQFRSTCISTPLEGMELIGRVRYTLVGGEVRFSG